MQADKLTFDPSPGSLWLGRLQRLAWALLLVTLPVTSFPYFPEGFGGRTLIRPLSVYPLIVLVLLVTLPRLYRRPLPRTFLPFLAFVVIAFASSLLSLAFGSEVVKGVSMFERILRNLVTLGIGGALYFTVVLMPQSWQDLRASLRWLYLGFALAMSWGSLQALYVIHYSPAYFKLLSRLQGFISTRKLFATRISGPTYEPKWFAEQICFLLLPWLLASVISRRTIFPWRFRWITVEWILLLWAMGMVLFTFSRTGLFILIILTFLSILAARPHNQTPSERKRRFGLAISATLLITVLILIVGAQNRYFSRFWRYFSGDAPARKSYLDYIAFRQRFVYLETAFRIFDSYPLLGVGLGNYAFYFDEMLPDEPWFRNPEILRQITPLEGGNRLITPKNFYGRLLAETGLVGAILFTTFVLAVLGCALWLRLSPEVERRVWGLAGLFGMFVFAIAIFSFDSFALPNMWVVFGLITAAAHLPSEQANRQVRDVA